MRVYSLKHESEEVLAAACAKTSRDPRPFDEIMSTIDEDQAAGYLDRIFLGYNHESVADIACPTIAFEGVSILASKALEANRRGLYQEKSTRYQTFTRDSVYQPPAVDFTPEEIDIYRAGVVHCFRAYEELTGPMMAWAETVVPQDVKNRAGAVRGKAFDSLRSLLPCGTTTQLAARMPANDWRDLVQQLYARDEPELTAIARQIRGVLDEVVPTLVKRAEGNPWLVEIRERRRQWMERQTRSPRAQEALLDWRESMGFPEGAPQEHPWSVNLQTDASTLTEVVVLCRLLGPDAVLVGGANERAAWQWFDDLMAARRTRHDRVPMELEALHYTFNVVMDYGAYRDLQRQRRCSIFPSPMTPDLGFQVPEGATAAGLHEEFRQALAIAGMKAKALGESTLKAYATPLGFNHCSSHIYDGAQVYYVGELRTGPGCHISYWRVVHEMVRLVQQLHPRLFKHVKLTAPSVLGAHS